ncbi:MAG: hypothetical protein GX241_02590 [Ruminococcaceae bacterium]|nr:hypothetical protein [Oscillospiraceae bacterium]
MEITNVLTEMAKSLATLALKGTATVIHSKIESVKLEKNAEKIRTTYDEIVNQLLSEREEAIRLAQAYKEELDKVQISDEDISHLHNTVKSILEILKKLVPDLDGLEFFEEMKGLISVDVLKTMQLLGFNYKAAIGEPLTKFCAESIEHFSSSVKKKNINKNKR